MNFLDQIKEVFLLGMSQGYAASPNKISIEEMPNAKAIPFSHGRFTMLDTYVANSHSGKSMGSTMIWCKDIPMWSMQYGGHYTSDVLPFLKQALLHQYAVEGLFYGGRGPIHYGENKMCYVNLPKQGKYKIDDFEGEEYIFVDSKVVGYHWYRGMCLLDDGTRMK